MKFPNGHTYQGDWKNDEISGKGIYKWDGRTYEGEFYRGKKHGKIGR